MIKYTSSSRFLNYEAVMASLILIALAAGIFTSVELIWIKVFTIIFLVVVLIFLILYLRKKVFTIKFLETLISVDYIYLNKKIEISYDELIKVEFISVHKSPDRNRIKFMKGDKVESLRFLSIAQSDNYIKFVKWLKSKNEKIELTVFPSDHIMNHKIQEVYGFKYR
ncbi:hypothetical protein H7F37_07125 [Winogradskyella sp. PAMC22761]|nr:hypothetical protein H7F37_07125 [Winogradskyella sp. PAMC22761]